MIYCPECGAQNSDQNAVCTNCNTALPQMGSAPPTATSGPQMVPAPPPTERPQTGRELVPTSRPEEIVIDTTPKVYCPDCGKSNAAHNRRCDQCGNMLPGTQIRPRTGPRPPIRSGSWWQQRSAAFRAAVIIASFVFVLQFVDALSGSLGFFFSAPFHVAAYFVQGLLVGKYLREDASAREKNYTKEGFISALWRIGIGIGIYVLFLLLGGAITLGTILLLVPILIVVSIFTSLFNIGLTGLGSWIYGRTGGKNLVGISIGIIVLGTVGACGLIAVTFTILAAIGLGAFYSIFGYVLFSLV